MQYEKEHIEIALEMIYTILKDGSVEKNIHPDHFMRYERDSEIREVLDICAEKFRLYVCERGDSIFLSPGINNKVFGMTNEEIKNDMFRGGKNAHMYTAFFIMHVLIGEFYAESMYDTPQRNRPITYITDMVDAKIKSLADLEDIDGISKEYKFNFREVKDLWESLYKADIDMDTGKAKEGGIGTRVGLIYETLKFMTKHQLITIHADAIYPLPRFKAMVSEAYSNTEVQTDILEFIEDLAYNGDDASAEN